MDTLDRLPKALQVATVIAFAAMVALAVACGGSEQGPAGVDSENNSSLVAGAASAPGSDFEAQFYCKNVESLVALERYLIGAQRDEGLPPPSSPEYQDALPPICIVSPMGGVPPYTASASVEGQELRRVTTGTTELTFILPPLPPGSHTVEFAVTDSDGERGSGTSEIEVGWKDPERARISFTEPSTVLADYDPGEAVTFEADYEVFDPTEQPQLGIESFLSQTYKVRWDFGDGTVETNEIDARSGSVATTHTYDADGLYLASVSITGNTFGQIQTALVNIDIRPEGSTRVETGEIVQNWKLVGTSVNPANGDLRTREVNRVFPDDNLNDFVENTIAIEADSITLIKVNGKGTKESFIGNYDVEVATLPGVLTAGQTATFEVNAGVTDVVGTDPDGETVRISGLPGTDDITVHIANDNRTETLEATFEVPSPTGPGETIVITLSVDGCDACIIQWTYRYG